MSEINLSGETPRGYENVVIPDDVYVGKLKDIDDRVATVNSRFGSKPRILLRWEVTTAQGAKEVPQFLNPNVSKGSGTYSNTSSYDLIYKAGLIDRFASLVGNRQAIADQELIQFLKSNLATKNAKVLTKVKTRGDGTSYSSVKDVVSFV